MTIPTHVLLGTVIGLTTGNIPLAIAVSVAVDVDHFVSYFRSGVIYHPKKFWKVITSEEDPFGDQRGILHNVIVASVISILVWFMFPAYGLTFALAYLGHLLLDAMDLSPYWPLYPSKKINLTGFVRFYSWREAIFASLLIVVLVLVF